MFIVEDTEMFYGRKESFPLKAETYKIIGLAIEVHKTLGKGFLEIIYKDALELELKWAEVPYTREKSFMINYKGTLLKRLYNADFVVYDKIIVEIKSQTEIIDANYKQTINYLAVSNLSVGLILNFGKESLSFHRVILT
ncbi:MAG: GxxExxY protein [Bacteroidales bacterium]|nr:GxxExxY protein [Bacteroidales bacterium]